MSVQCSIGPRAWKRLYEIAVQNPPELMYDKDFLAAVAGDCEAQTVSKNVVRFLNDQVNRYLLDSVGDPDGFIFSGNMDAGGTGSGEPGGTGSGEPGSTGGGQ